MKNRPLKHGLSVLGVLILLMFSPSYVVPQPHFQETAYESVAQEIIAGKLVPDKLGVVTLPGNAAQMSITRRAYCIRDETTNAWIVFFPSWVGRTTLFPVPGLDDDHWLEGYLFDQGSEGPSDGWGLNGPAFTAPWNAAGKMPPCFHALLCRRPLGRHWFEVELAPD